jgi:hypothetical protein
VQSSQQIHTSWIEERERYRERVREDGEREAKGGMGREMLRGTGGEREGERDGEESEIRQREENREKYCKNTLAQLFNQVFIVEWPDGSHSSVKGT